MFENYKTIMFDIKCLIENIIKSKCVLKIKYIVVSYVIKYLLTICINFY